MQISKFQTLTLQNQTYTLETHIKVCSHVELARKKRESNDVWQDTNQNCRDGRKCDVKLLPLHPGEHCKIAEVNVQCMIDAPRPMSYTRCSYSLLAHTILHVGGFYVCRESEKSNYLVNLNFPPISRLPKTSGRLPFANTVYIFKPEISNYFLGFWMSMALL